MLFLNDFCLAKLHTYSSIFPSMLPLNFALSLNVSSIISRLPPVVLGLMFLMVTSPSFFPSSSVSHQKLEIGD
jgi:hypothetical protein